MARVTAGKAAPSLEQIWASLESAARDSLQEQGATSEPTVRRAADCRYAGQSHELRVDLAAGADPVAGLHAAHEALYGYRMPDEDVEIVTLRVVAEGTPALGAPPQHWDLGEDVPAPPDREVVVDGVRRQVEVVDRRTIAAGEQVEGPAVIEQPDATTVLSAGEVAEADAAGNLVVRLEPARGD